MDCCHRVFETQKLATILYFLICFSSFLILNLKCRKSYFLTFTFLYFVLPCFCKMQAFSTINATERNVGKKSSVKNLLKNKMVPGVIYLKSGNSVSVSASFNEMNAIANDPSGKARLYEVKLGGKSIYCILKDMQFMQIVDTPRHFDLMQVEAEDIVRVNIPIRVLNKEICPGVKSGGDIYRLVYNVDLKCKANDIPYAIEIDVKDCQMGTKIFLSDVKLADGCQIINNPLLIRVAGKRVIKETEAVADATTTSEATEGNVTDTGNAATEEEKK